MNNLLVISPQYLAFVKDQVECMASNFSEVSVMIHQNHLKKMIGRRSAMDLDGTPSNVHVQQTPAFGLPIEPFYRLSGDSHYRAVRKRISSNNAKFDLVHCHFAWSAGYVGARLHQKLKMPLVVTCHGYDIYDLPFRNDRWKKRIERVLNASNQIITVSQSNLRCIQKLEVSTPVSIIPNGYQKSLFHPRESGECRRKLGLPLDKEIVLAVGNLVPVKGHEFLIRAAKIVREQRANALFVIIGSGIRKDELLREIHSLGLEKHILLVGSKPHDEISIWMGAADLIVLSSLNEGNPTVMVEALGCGKPFISTNVGGVPEVITSDDYGLLAEPANPEDLAEKILLALEKKWDRNAILLHAERYTWDRITKEIIGVYEKALE